MLLMPQRTQSHFIESNKRADDLLMAEGMKGAADTEPDQQSIDKMLLVEDGSDEDEMLV